MLCWRLTLGYSKHNTDRSILKGNAKVSSSALGKKTLRKSNRYKPFFSFPTKLILSAVADKKIYIQFMKTLTL